MAAPDLRVANPYGAAVLIDLDALVVGRAQAAFEPPAPVDGRTGAHGNALADGPAEVLGLHQRPVETGRGHLERVLLPKRRELTADALAQVEVHASCAVNDDSQLAG